MKIRKILALVLAAVMLIGIIAACGSTTGNGDTNTSASVSPGAETSPSNTEKTYETEPALGGNTGPTSETAKFAEAIDIVSDSNSTPNLDPFVATGGSPGKAWAAKLMWDTLLAADVDVQNPLPGLATEWSSDDLQNYKLKLREGVIWSNGDKFTADDVINTFNYAKDLVGTPAYNQLWRYIDTITKVDDFNIVIKTTAVNVDFIFALQNVYGVIINTRAIEADPENGLFVGTGPYDLKEFVPNNYWVLEAKDPDQFWGKPVITKKLTFRFIPEITNRATMLLNGETQLAMRIGVQDMELFEGNDKFTIFDRALNNTNPIVFNMKDPVCGDFNFRMAVLYAIDKSELTFAYGGKYALPNLEAGSLWGRYTEFKNKDIPLYTQDIEKAKEYLAKSNYKGETIEIAAMSQGQIAASPLFQQMLEEIGIKTEIKVLELATANDYVGWGKNNMQMYLATVPQSFTTQDFSNLVYPGGSTNYANYERPEVTALIDEAYKTVDYEKRAELWKEIQELVAEDRPFENITWYVETIVGVKGVDGFIWCVDAYYNMRYIYWEIEE